ncbi:DUF742 domain-containing protein [Prauserella muralis]|uniref:Uncharacterized protein n=1 Tax=Prauserella muralis TaxID=588067 RepID=A0A2V4AQ13_9PSEU|nr:DUF742 domain-containing protein [Prauserella muralis]PXY22677.1 hypothetical protein BAY60_22945 [Prauserella muralis]TWE28390.1 uncharacterized protein DUF742 [Prauserella muralis]
MSSERWFGDDSGPMVRLYALTRGRARPNGEFLDVIALIGASTLPEHDLTLSPEQAAILDLCRTTVFSVAEIASRVNLPLNVLRVLLADLAEDGHIRVTHPTLPGRLPDDQILREVLDGLRAL